MDPSRGSPHAPLRLSRPLASPQPLSPPTQQPSALTPTGVGEEARPCFPAPFTGSAPSAGPSGRRLKGRRRRVQQQLTGVTASRRAFPASRRPGPGPGELAGTPGREPRPGAAQRPNCGAAVYSVFLFRTSCVPITENKHGLHACQPQRSPASECGRGAWAAFSTFLLGQSAFLG